MNAVDLRLVERQPALAPHHAAMLIRASAIAPEMVEARGYRTVERLSELGGCGFNRSRHVTQAMLPGLLIPLHGPTGDAVGYVLRPDRPRTDAEGRVVKYETPTGMRPRLDVPLTVRERIGDPAARLVVTEGARKADAIASWGLCSVNLAGVWNWKGRNDHRGSVAIGDWECIALNDGRPVTVAFDSDALTKRQVALALRRLVTFLRGRGAEVSVARLPDGPGGEKWGVDDFKAAGHSRDDFLSLVGPPDGHVPTASGLPVIVVTNRQLRDVGDEAHLALCEANVRAPVVFVRSGRLVRPRFDEERRPFLEPMGESEIRGRLARVAEWRRVDKDGDHSNASPPIEVVRDVLARPEWGSQVPPLEAIIEAPVLRPDGTVLAVAGYDRPTRLLYQPAPGLRLGPVHERPSAVAVHEALTLLQTDLLGDFPFVEDGGASRAHALALLLTPILRPVIQGPVPLALIDAPQMGAGKTLLGDSASLTASGRTAGMMAAPVKEEEWEKKLTAVLMSGTSVVVIDNVAAPLDSPSLNAVLTGSTWSSRVLGRSEMVTLPVRCTWLATGNNIRLRGDLPRRCYRIRLDPQTSRPWQRTGFRHPELRDWVTEHRGELLGALLTLSRAWYAAGCPTDGPTLGSFEAWSRTVGGVLAVAGVAGFLGNLESLYAEVDEDGPAWEAFLATLHERFGDRAVTAAAIGEEARTDGSEIRLALPDDLADVLVDPKRESSFQRRLGKALSRKADVRFGPENLHLTAAGKSHSAVLWRVRRGVLPMVAGGSLGSVGEFVAADRYAGTGARACASAQAHMESATRNSPELPNSPPHVDVPDEPCPACGGPGWHPPCRPAPPRVARS